jgi:hypothetical protein
MAERGEVMETVERGRSVARKFRVVSSVLAATCLVPVSASAASSNDIPVQTANRSVQSAIQTAIVSVRDFVRAYYIRRQVTQVPGRLTSRFSGDPYAEGYDPFEALAYGKGGLVTKAPPKAAPVGPTYFVSVWGQGSADREERDITFNSVLTSTTTTSYTGVSGADVVRIGLFAAADALVIGGLGNYTTTDADAISLGVTTSTRSLTRGGAAYLAYINGGFSIDFSYSANTTSTSGTTALVAIAPVNTDSQSISGNVQYRYDLQGNWWWEPTVGFTYTTYSLDTVGFVDGHTWRVQGGARVGTELTYGSVKVTPSLQGLVFSDVEVQTPVAAGTVFVGATDEGYLWGKGIGKVNVQWTDKFSTSVEGEVRGRSDVIGYAGRLMARYTF